MLRSSQYENELIGSIEDINISDITQSLNLLRNSSEGILELADSIGKIGLLSPILVRVMESGNFEIVAGNRRFKACKSLGWRKISCKQAINQPPSQRKRPGPESSSAPGRRGFCVLTAP